MAPYYRPIYLRYFFLVTPLTIGITVKTLYIVFLNPHNVINLLVSVGGPVVFFLPSLRLNL